MKLVVLVALLSAVPGIAPAAEEKPTPRAEPSLQAPLGQVLEWTSPRGKPYWYRLPRRLGSKQPANLLLMLHGTGLKWGWAFWNYPIAGGAFRGEDIVVAPEGMTPGQGETFNFVQGEPDGDHIAEMIGLFKKQFPIAKVYVYGHSQGAFFAYWFAGEHPELVDGIVAHAGNVLQVKHPKLAKEKVAIGILHGRADAVVPVECAFRTEKIYRDQGYKQVKLQIVEGLTEQSGHWPLPKQVGEMLAWLDSVSADNPRLALAGALQSLAHDEPDLGAARDAAARAGAFLKAYKGKDRAELTERLDAVRKLLDDAAKAHADAIAAAAGKGKPPFGAWASHYLRASRALEPLPAWQKATSAIRQRAAAQEKLVARALVLVDQAGAKAFGEGLGAIEGGFLAGRYDDLFTRLEGLAKDSTVKAEDRKKFQDLAAARTPARDEGIKAVVAIDQKLVKAFREAHAAWFEEAMPKEAVR